MEKVILSNEKYMELLSRKPDFGGREGNLYKVGSHLYKLYHNPYFYSDIRLKEIILFQSKIKHTILPLGAIYFGSQFIGSILHPFENTSPFESLYHDDLSVRIQKLRELSLNLQELTNQGLVLNDLFYGNVVLAEDKTIQLIDTDGDNMQFLQSDQQLDFMLGCFRGLILECCIPGATCFDYLKLTDQIMNDQNRSYEALEQLLIYLGTNEFVKQYQKTIK